jgi:hypothetical protein
VVDPRRTISLLPRRAMQAFMRSWPGRTNAVLRWYEGVSRVQDTDSTNPLQQPTRSEQVEVVIKQDIDDTHLNILTKEYELALHRTDKYGDRLIQLIAVGLPLLGALTAYIVTKDEDKISTYVALLSPMAFVLFLSMVINIYISINFYNGLCRVLSVRTNMLLKEISLIQFEPESPIGYFFSLRRGNLMYRISAAVVLLGTYTLFLLLIYVNFQTVYKENHLYGSLFLLFYIGLVLLTLAMLRGLIYEVSEIFRVYTQQVATRGFGTKTGSEEVDEKTARNMNLYASALTSFKFAMLAISPRPKDLILKGIWFWYGFAAAYSITNISERNLDRINLLFRGKNDWGDPADVPFWSVLGLAMVYFVVQEIFLQQAKLLWDDIRDKERDKLLPHNRGRAVASEAISHNTAILQMVIRWTAAFVLGYLLGGVVLVFLFLFISLHQAVYVLWGKQSLILGARVEKGDTRRFIREEARYLLLLYIISANLFPRFLGGVIAVNVSVWHGLPFILICMLSIVTYLISFGTMALFWKIEKKDLIQKGLSSKEDEMPRPQSTFFLNQGERWQYGGFLAAVIFSVFTVLIYVAFQICNVWPPQLQNPIGLCSVVNDFVEANKNSILTRVLVLVFLFGLAIICVTFLAQMFPRYGGRVKEVIGYRFGRSDENTDRSGENADRDRKRNNGIAIKDVVAPVLLGAYHVGLILAMAWESTILLLVSFCLMSVAYLTMFEGMTYEEFTLDKYRKELPIFLGKIYAFLFTAPSAAPRK